MSQPIHDCSCGRRRRTTRRDRAEHAAHKADIDRGVAEHARDQHAMRAARVVAAIERGGGQPAREAGHAQRRAATSTIAAGPMVLEQLQRLGKAAGPMVGSIVARPAEMPTIR